MSVSLVPANCCRKAWRCIGAAPPTKPRRAITDVLRIDPANANALYYLALISCQHGRFEEGAFVARKSLACDPKQARSHVILGRALHALGLNDDALASFDRAIALAPELAPTHTPIALTC